MVKVSKSEKEQFIKWVNDIRDQLDKWSLEGFDKLRSVDLYPFYKANVKAEDMADPILKEHVDYDHDDRIVGIVTSGRYYGVDKVNLGDLPKLGTVIYTDTWPLTEEELLRLNNTSVNVVYEISEDQYNTMDRLHRDLYPIPYTENLDYDKKYTFDYLRVIWEDEDEDEEDEWDSDGD